MHPDWQTVNELYTSSASLNGVKRRPEYLTYVEKMLAALGKIQSNQRLSQIKPGTMHLTLWLLPQKTSTRIFVAWDQNRYVVTLGTFAADQPDGFPDGKVYASLDELAGVIEQFVDYVEVQAGR